VSWTFIFTANVSTLISLSSIGRST
jgi:hypothetical protein